MIVRSDVRQEINPDLVVGLYTRLHERLANPDTLFDASWDLQTCATGTLSRWVLDLFLGGAAQTGAQLFRHVAERFAILKPFELQEIFCLLAALTRREELRRCIDGKTLRAIQGLLGEVGIDAIVDCKLSLPLPLAATNWSCPSLCAEGFANLTSSYSGGYPEALTIIRYGLPRNMPIVESFWTDKTLTMALSEIRQWYPEQQWLFG